VKIKGNEKYEFYSIQLQCRSTSRSTQPKSTHHMCRKMRPNPTQPNPTYGWSQPMSISGTAARRSAANAGSVTSSAELMRLNTDLHRINSNFLSSPHNVIMNVQAIVVSKTINMTHSHCSARVL